MLSKKLYWKKTFTLACFLSLSTYLFAQDTISQNKSIPKPSILPAHVFGIFISRIEADFRTLPSEKLSLQLDYLSANIWGQPVENFIPTSTELKQKMLKLPWHTREFSVDKNDVEFQNNTQNFKIAFDGVIKGLKAKLYIPINSQNDLSIEIRSFLLTDGKFPFTGITGDDFIENFHSNIAGGEDPFQRRDFVLNQNKIDFTDRQGKRMLLEDDFIFGGLQLNYHHFFKYFKPLGINFNTGIHIGLNASKFNQSLDIGWSTNLVKNFSLNENQYIQLGLGLGYLNLETLSFSNDNIEFGTRSYFLNLESALTYNIAKHSKTHTFGIDYYIQSAYNDPDEFDFSILFRNDKAITSWHHSASHLYKNNSYWTFFYAFTKNNSFKIYLQQDLVVNNSPDFKRA